MLLFALIWACHDKPTPADDSTVSTDDSEEPTSAWPHCPGSDAYVGDASWQGLAQASGALYCSLPNEERDLPGELKAKAMLRVVDGDYPLPSLEGSYALTFPVCTLRAEGAEQPAMDGEGSTAVSVTNFGGSSYTYVEGSQPMRADGAWELAHTLVLAGDEGAAPDPLRLDGGGPNLSTGESATFALYEAGGNPFEPAAMTFGPCEDSSWVHNIHTLSFEGGELRLELSIGTDNIMTAPSQLLRASGSIDGASFDISDYFRLIYRPGHHHYSRDFAVLLDAPVGDVCAILVEEVDGQPGTDTAVVHVADCALSPLAERAVSAEDWTTE